MILFIYCAGGFGKEVADIADRINKKLSKWQEIKFIDDYLVDSMKYGNQVIKSSDMFSRNNPKLDQIIIASGEPAVRKKLSNVINENTFKLGRLIDYTSLVSSSAKIDDGVIVAPFCSISSEASLCKNSCINTMTIIGHDVTIGENTVISSMVNMGGGCVVGENSYVGMGALIKEGVKIGSNSIVGMGSVVYNQIPDGVIALGNPARVIQKNINQKVFK